MLPFNDSGIKASPAAQWFATTHWSVVLDAAQEEKPGAKEALNKICASYWEPLFAFVRRQGYGIEDSEDLTQQFLARLLQKNRISMADPKRGRFRTFLLSSMKNFLANEWAKSNREKRGGGYKFFSLEREDTELPRFEPSDQRTPETVYEERWAATIMSRTMAMLRDEQAGRTDWFELLKEFIWGSQQGSIQELAKTLGSTEGAVRVAVHRLRSRYKALLRSEISKTVAHPEEVNEELRYLIEVVSRSPR